MIPIGDFILDDDGSGSRVSGGDPNFVHLLSYISLWFPRERG